MRPRVSTALELRVGDLTQEDSIPLPEPAIGATLAAMAPGIRRQSGWSQSLNVFNDRGI